MTAASVTQEAFALAFGDMPVEEALRLREQTDFRALPSTDRHRYDPLCSIAALDAFLQSGAAQCPPVTMADASRQGSAGVPDHEFADDNGRIIPSRVFTLFDKGATLVVSQFHEHHRPLARFCRGLERLFRHPVQCNIYLTPPGAQGFRVHYDTHDVLVMQIQGAKAWRLWHHQPVPHPTRQTPWPGGKLEPEGEPVKLVMQPGDALYVPRGVLHDAVSQDPTEASLHLTIGLLEPSWTDVLHAALDELEQDDAALRAPFPTWRLGEPETMPALLQEVAAKVQSLARPEVLERVAMASLDKLARERLPMVGRGLLTPMPEAGTALRLTDTMHHHVAAGPDGQALRWSGGVMPLSEQELGWLQELDEGTTPAALGEGALEFCTKLARLGLVERV